MDMEFEGSCSPSHNMRRHSGFKGGELLRPCALPEKKATYAAERGPGALDKKFDRMLNSREQHRYLRKETEEEDVEMQNLSSGEEDVRIQEMPSRRSPLQEELDDWNQNKFKITLRNSDVVPQESLGELLFAQSK